MSKQKNEPGLAHMISLGFSPAKTLSGVEDQIAKVSDRNTARRFLKEIEKRADGIMDNPSFYSWKNNDYNVSLALTSAFDADILRKACNWIASHSEYFGDTILEIGCDCGVMSCFLAKEFPQSNIVAIDRCAEAIENAKKLAQKQGLQNVSFISCDLKDVEGTFDTIFSMRTVHENYSAKEDVVNDLSEQAAVFRDSLYEYASALSQALSDQGRLISIERIGRNALLLGWMEALSAAGLFFDVSCYEELKCVEVGSESVFQAFISFNGIESTISPKELFDFACSKYLDYTQAVYEGWDAKIVFENRRGTLIEGYALEYTKLHVKARISLWTHNTDDTCLVVYQNNNGNVVTTFHDISEKENLLEGMHKALDESRSFGNVIISDMKSNRVLEQ